ncbi:MAG: N-acetylglucosamine-6-phosphate deacetylase [Cyclobacteriaceae bacterium]|nr:N-acetylglucosamine-6-phosphate deacetylase [Cyclobacteriaceae bacterium]
MKIEAISYDTGKPVKIEISGDKITKIKNTGRSNAPLLYVAPGLIDIQINGYMGVDFSDQGLTPEMLRSAVEALWAQGVTTILPTVITASPENLLNSFKLLAEALTDQKTALTVPGFHLEGPYLSPEKGFRGAHLEKYIRNPDWAEFTALQAASGNRIKIVTIAPETDGALSFIHNCAQSGVLVSLGHHNGNMEQITMATDAGARLSTHLGNGCANLIDRHNNPIWPQLSEDRLSISIIADGFHLNRQEVRTFYKAKGTEKVILVSDALDLAGMPPGEYLRSERKVLLTKDVVKFPDENVLAGAASPISACVGNMMDFTNCSLSESISMATINPAKLLGFHDRGELAEDKRADLILFAIENGKLIVYKTILAGQVVYEKK